MIAIDTRTGAHTALLVAAVSAVPSSFGEPEAT